MPPERSIAPQRAALRHDEPCRARGRGPQPTAPEKAVKDKMRVSREMCHVGRRMRSTIGMTVVCGTWWKFGRRRQGSGSDGLCRRRACRRRTSMECPRGGGRPGQALGLGGISKFEVSRVCGAGSGRRRLRTRALTGEHRYLWLDATRRRAAQTRPRTSWRIAISPLEHQRQLHSTNPLERLNKANQTPGERGGHLSEPPRCCGWSAPFSRSGSMRGLAPLSATASPCTVRRWASSARSVP